MLLTTRMTSSSALATVFKFSSGPSNRPPFSFPHPTMSTPQSRKRTRALSDLDDQPATSKKKRRLRLRLVTSRLSRPFSTPATHIVDRGSSKIAVWAKQKHLIPQALRKAAIMNRVRRKSLEREAWLRKDSGISVGGDERLMVREAVLKESKLEGTNASGKFPDSRKSFKYAPVTPSPLGLSNYDALDDEDGYYDDEHQYCSSCPNSPQKEMNEGIGAKEAGEYYSDFNFLDSVQEDRESDAEYDDPFSLSVLPAEIVMEKRPPSPPDGRWMELMKEKERQREVLFLEFT